MQSQEAWKIVEDNIPSLVSQMLDIQKGAWIDLHYDLDGKKIYFSKAPGGRIVKLASVTTLDLGGHYGIHMEGNAFVNDEEEEFSKDQVVPYIAQSIINMKNEGAEWGWEFKISPE